MTATSPSADLAGRRVLLTGASRGVGAAVARRLVAAGADVIGTARDAAALDRLAAELADGPGSSTAVLAELTDEGLETAQRASASYARERRRILKTLSTSEVERIDAAIRLLLEAFNEADVAARA